MYTKKDTVYGRRDVINSDGGHPLQQWTQACEQFCELRRRVNILIKQRLACPAHETGTRGFVSQCSVTQLIGLEMDMTEELERLLTDINQRRGGSFSKKLMNHVTILGSWSKRAQSVLNLAVQSSC